MYIEFVVMIHPLNNVTPAQNNVSHGGLVSINP